MVDRDKYVFDFPRTEENRELYSSHIDWEKEELEEKNKEKESKKAKK